MSDWKRAAAARRDARAAKDPEPARARTARGKNSKRWCRGKVGKEHTPKCMKCGDVKRWGFSGLTWRVLVCTTCGRELEIWWGRKPKPEWVTE